MSRHTAQIAFENDLLSRRWAAMQSGVYVRVSEDAPQGYREGDIRGGLSVAVPMASLRAVTPRRATASTAWRPEWMATSPSR